MFYLELGISNSSSILSSHKNIQDIEADEILVAHRKRQLRTEAGGHLIENHLSEEKVVNDLAQGGHSAMF